MIAAIYARKSTDQNLPDAEKSVTRQIEHATAYAERKGWTVDPAHTYSADGISGAEFVKRPGLTRLMTAVKPRAPFQVLVMSEESRLGREQIETAYLLKQLITAGVRVAYYLEDRERTLDSPTDKILLAVSGFADEVERDKARQRTYDAMRRKAGAGHVTGGVVFGYVNVPVLTADGKPDHVTRRILEPEAAVVRRIFTLSAEGLGTRRIAHTLNAEGAPAPKPRRVGRPQAWDPATIYAMLTRPLYRGEIVWNQTKKRDAWGVQAQRPRAEADWLRVPAPELRIVPEPLWRAVERRLASMRTAYLRTTRGTLYGRAPGASGLESKYLLTGLAECGTCHGGLTVHSRATAGVRTFAYLCGGYHRKGPTVCDNRRVLGMTATNAEVLRTIETTCLSPVAVERIVAGALAALTRPPETLAAREATLRADLAALETEIARYTAAVGQAPDLASLLDALRTRERQRATLRGELDGLRRLREAGPIDRRGVERQVRAVVADWRGLMGKQVAESRRLLKGLLEGRVVFTPRADESAIDFTGRVRMGPLLVGALGTTVGGVPDGTRAFYAGVPGPVGRLKWPAHARLEFAG